MEINKEAINDAKSDLAKAKKSAETAASSVARIVPPEGFSVNYSAIAAEIRALYNKIDSANKWISNKVTAVEQAESQTQAIISQVGASFSGISVGGISKNSYSSSPSIGKGSSYSSSSSISSTGSSPVSGEKSENEINDIDKDIKNKTIESKKSAIEEILKKNDVLGSVDKKILDKYKEEILKDASNGKLDLENMNDKQIQNELVKRILQKENLSVDKSFGILEELNGNYGISQKALKNMNEEETNKYIETISNQYNLSKEDASKIVQAIKNSELDGYDTQSNLIYASFKNEPEKFEKVFGFSLYKTDSEGTISINDVGIITDVFLTVNSNACGGKLLTITDDGKMNLNSNLLEIDGSGNFKLKEQQDLSSSENIQALMSDYMKTKPEGIELKTEMINGKISPAAMTDEKMNDIKEKIKTGIDDNKGQIVLNLYQDKEHPIKFIDAETKTEYCSTADWKENTEHEVLVTDVNDEGVVVSSWGKKYTISFDDLKNNGNFQTYNKEYSFNKKQINTTENIATNVGGVTVNANSNDNTNINTEINLDTKVDAIGSNIEKDKSN